MGGGKIDVDPDVVAGLGNEMYSISVRLRGKPATVGAGHVPALGRAEDGSALGQTYSHLTQTAMSASDALCGSLETNGQYVLYAAQNADDAFN